MNPTQATAELASISVSARIPEFWAEMPRMWFAQFEAVMEPQKQSDLAKFQMVVAKLTKDALQQAHDLILAPPAEKAYIALKQRLLTAFEDSAERQFQKLVNEMDLGSQRPSQLLRRMSELARNTEVSDDALKRLWISRLPGSVKAVLSVCQDTKLDNLAMMADKIAENLHADDVAAVSAATPEGMPVTELAVMMAKLETKLKEIKQEVNEIREGSVGYRPRWKRSRSRSRSRGPRRTPDSPDWLCRYHFRFRQRARMCEKPCNWKASPSEN